VLLQKEVRGRSLWFEGRPRRRNLSVWGDIGIVSSPRYFAMAGGIANHLTVVDICTTVQIRPMTTFLRGRVPGSFSDVRRDDAGIHHTA